MIYYTGKRHFLLLISMSLILVAGAFFTWWEAKRTDRDMRQELLVQARLVTESLSQDQIKSLTGTEADMDKPNYLQIKKHFARAKEANNKCRFIYLVGRMQEGEVFFFVDNEPVGSEDESPAGQIYEEASDEFLQTFETHNELVEGPIEDRWGTWVTALVPIIDRQNGDLIAVLGMDVNAEAWNWDIATGVALPVCLVLTLLIILSVAIMAGKPYAKVVSLKPVQRRILIPLAAVLLMLVGGLVMALLITHRHNLYKSCALMMKNVSGEMDKVLEEQSQLLTIIIEEGLLNDAYLYKALKEQNRDQLLAQYKDRFEKLRADYNVTHFYFHGSDRVNLLRVHKPAKHGDFIDRYTARKAERSGKISSGIELGPLGTFTLRVVKPVYVDEELIGYLELGKEIEDILVRIQEEHGAEMAVSIDKAKLNRQTWEAGMEITGRAADWEQFSDKVIIYCSQAVFPEEIKCFVKEENHTHGDLTNEIEYDDKSWRVFIKPLIDASGVEVGDLIIIKDIYEAKVSWGRTIVIMLMGAVVILVGLFGFFYVILRRTDQGINNQQAALRESKDRFYQLAEQSRTVVWEINTEGLYTYVSKVIEETLGYCQEELVGRKHFYDLYPEDKRESLKKNAFEILGRKECFKDVESIFLSNWTFAKMVRTAQKDSETCKFRDLRFRKNVGYSPATPGAELCPLWHGSMCRKAHLCLKMP